MTKQDTVKDALEQLDNMTHDWRALPDRTELRELLKWIYEQGKESK